MSDSKPTSCDFQEGLSGFLGMPPAHFSSNIIPSNQSCSSTSLASPLPEHRHSGVTTHPFLKQPNIPSRERNRKRLATSSDPVVPTSKRCTMPYKFSSLITSSFCGTRATRSLRSATAVQQLGGVNSRMSRVPSVPCLYMFSSFWMLQV